MKASKEFARLFDMDVNRRDILRLMGAMVSGTAAAGLLAACGGDSDDDDEGSGDGGSGGSESTPAEEMEPTESDDSAVEVTEAPADEPDEDVKPPTLLHYSGSDPTTLDPQFGESSTMGSVLGQTMEALVGYDREMNPVPRLAESWEVLDDQVTWRFTLREGVVFHNGEPLTAEAVKFTIERTMDEDLQAQGLNDPFPSRSGIVSADIVDDLTIDLVLEEPNVIMPIFLGFLYILEPNYYSTTSIQDTALQPMGTGPYRVTEWVKGDHITFEVFPDYWRGEAPIKKFFYRPVPEAATRMNMLLTGEADISGNLASVDIPAVENDEKLRLSTAPGSRRAHIGIPTNNPKYKDRKVRQALVQAINYQELADAILGSIAPSEQRATTLVSSQLWEAPDLVPYQYDPDTAKQMLEESGFPFDETVNVYATNSTMNSEIAQAIAGYLRAIDINAEAQILDSNVYSDKMRSETGIDDLYYSSLGSRYNGPEDVSIVTTDQIWDQTHWSTETENGPKFGELYKELSKTFDEDAQHELVNEMLHLFHEEAVWMPLWILPTAAGVNKRMSWEDYGGGNRYEM